MIAATPRRPQRDFAVALLDPRRLPPPGLRAWNGSDVGRRFDVHRNNVVVSLVEVLAQTFPVLRRLLGDEDFGALAARFVREQPPRSPVMNDYGARLPAWLARQAPLRPLPWLADLARLERARVAACHAADATPLHPAALAQALAAPETLATLRLKFQPSLAVLRSRHAVVSLWAAHQHDDAAAPAAAGPGRPEAAIVLRQHDEVLVLALPPADARLAERLHAGRPLGDAIAAAPKADLSALLALLLRHDALVETSTP